MYGINKTDELMVQTEARICYSKSKKFRGRCYFRNQISNCKTICKREKFTTGRCSRGGCFCSRKCGSVSPPPPPPVDGGEGGGEGGGEEGGHAGGGGGGGEGGEAIPHH